MTDRIDYDLVSSTYDQRYARNTYAELAEYLRTFLADATIEGVAELGCGTGRWLQLVEEIDHVRLIVGLDLSAGMLSHARSRVSRAALVRGTADRLPWSAHSLDRVFCINALHHFTDRGRVFTECARVLRVGGAVMTIGLDPHTGTDQWWIYDYFPAALTADLERYPSTAEIRSQLEAAGFTRVETTIAQHVPARLPFQVAEAKGVLARHSTSQLMVISDEDWDAGLARMRREAPEVSADLRLYATIGWL